MNIWGYTFASVILVSFISFIGVFFLSLKEERLNRILLFLISIAVGGLFGDAIIHLIPQSYTELENQLVVSVLILTGIMAFFLVEKGIRWRHCHVPTSELHIHPVVALNIIGDGVHNLIDGMLIGASYGVSIYIGLTTTLAVVLHEIPQEVGDFGVLIHGGFSVKKALLFNFLSATMAIIGGITALLVGPHVQNFSLYMLPITAGGFIYIAAADLIPELQHECGLSISLRQFLFVTIGILLMALLVLFE